MKKATIKKVESGSNSQHRLYYMVSTYIANSV